MPRGIDLEGIVEVVPGGMVARIRRFREEVRKTLEVVTVESVRAGEIGATFDGLGAVIEAGSFGDAYVPFDCEIQAAVVLSCLPDETNASAVFDVRVDALTTGYSPDAVDSICGGSKPTLASQFWSLDTTLTGWNRRIAAGSVVRIVCESASVTTKAVVALPILKL